MFTFGGFIAEIVVCDQRWKSRFFVIVEELIWRQNLLATE